MPRTKKFDEKKIKMPVKGEYLTLLDMAHGLKHGKFGAGMAKEVYSSCLKSIVKARTNWELMSTLRERLSVSARQRFAQLWKSKKTELEKREAINSLLALFARMLPAVYGGTEARLTDFAQRGFVSDLAPHFYAEKNYDAVFAELLHFHFEGLDTDIELLPEIEEILDFRGTEKKVAVKKPLRRK